MSEVVDVINELKNLLEVCDKLSIYKNEKEKKKAQKELRQKRNLSIWRG